MIQRDNNFGGLFGPDEPAAAPTVGLSISPWLIGLVAAVWLIPKLFHTYRTTRRESKP